MTDPVILRGATVHPIALAQGDSLRATRYLTRAWDATWLRARAEVRAELESAYGAALALVTDVSEAIRQLDVLADVEPVTESELRVLDGNR